MSTRTLRGLTFCPSQVPGSEPSLIDGEVLSRLPWLSNLPGTLATKYPELCSRHVVRLHEVEVESTFKLTSSLNI